VKGRGGRGRRRGAWRTSSSRGIIRNLSRGGYAKGWEKVSSAWRCGAVRGVVNVHGGEA